MSIPLALLVLATAAPPDADTLKARAAAVVSQKARMPNRYALTIRVEGRIPNAKPPLETQTSATYMIWRDGNKFRNDRLDVKHSPPRPSHIPGERHIGCENCEREGYGISTTVLPGSPPAQHMVEFKRLGTWSFDRYCNIFDWRYFGLRNDRQCGYERAHVATDFPALFDQPGGIRLEARGGQPCVVATKKATANKYERSVWLSEREEFNPVFFEESFEVKGDAERRTTEIDWQKTSGGHFFPKRAQTNSIITFEGDKYASEEIVTITHADFNSLIDPAVFTVAGFGLNENQVIGYPELEFKDQPRWRNGKVDYSETAGKPPSGGATTDGGAAPAAPYPTESNLSLILGVVAAALAIGTAVAALVIRRRRAAA